MPPLPPPALTPPPAHSLGHPTDLAYQDVHEPVEVPPAYEAAYATSIADQTRRTYAGMVSVVDEGLANLTAGAIYETAISHEWISNLYFIPSLPFPPFFDIKKEAKQRGPAPCLAAPGALCLTALCVPVWELASTPMVDKTPWSTPWAPFASSHRFVPDTLGSVWERFVLSVRTTLRLSRPPCGAMGCTMTPSSW